MADLRAEIEALLDLLRTEVPSYVDFPSAMWGASHVLLIARRETPTTAAHPVQEEGADGECPNCVTPWKCNGPHVPWPPIPDGCLDCGRTDGGCDRVADVPEVTP